MEAGGLFRPRKHCDHRGEVQRKLLRPQHPHTWGDRQIETRIRDLFELQIRFDTDTE